MTWHSSGSTTSFSPSIKIYCPSVFLVDPLKTCMAYMKTISFFGFAMKSLTSFRENPISKEAILVTMTRGPSGSPITS